MRVTFEIFDILLSMRCVIRFTFSSFLVNMIRMMLGFYATSHINDATTIITHKLHQLT